MFNSRAKGNKFERQVSLLLHRMICDAIKQSPDQPLIVRRRTTTVTPDDDFKGAGDLQIAKDAADRLVDVCGCLPCVECKALADVTLASLMVPNKAVTSAWLQACRQAHRASEREEDFQHVPLVAFAIKRVGIAVVTEEDLWNQLYYIPQNDQVDVRCIFEASNVFFADVNMYSTLAIFENPK